MFFKIHLFHNIVWSKYKGGVFSRLYPLANSSGIDLEITQIAETDFDRVGLGGVDMSYHKYPFTLLFKGSYASIPKVRLVLALFKAVYTSKADLILIPGYHTSEYWGMLFAAKLQNKVVGVFCDSTKYDNAPSTFKGIFKRIFFSQCDVFFGYGLRSHEYLKMYGAKPEHIFFRCQAAALPHDYNPAPVPLERLARKNAATAPRFLYVGRLSPEKDLRTLFSSFALVLQSVPNALLVVVGSGPAKADLLALRSELGLVQNIEFTGSKDVQALREEYLSASCFVLPSVSEPWGLVVNEALSYGCPVIVSNRCGCVPELVVDGVTGYSFEANDVADLASKMVKVLIDFSDPVTAANRCLAVISTFTPEAAAKQILEGSMATLVRMRPNE